MKLLKNWLCMVCCNRQFKYYYDESLKGWILGVALCGATFFVYRIRIFGG